MIHFSVIIPHKNSPELLKRCVDSIPFRDDLEIIVVDDNSKEDYRRLVNNIVSSRKDIQLIQCLESKGGGHARNRGVDCSKGKYLIFSDADDYFDDTFWKEIDSIVDTDNAEIIYFRVKGVYSDTKLPAKRGENYDGYVIKYLSGHKNSEERLRYYHMVPWGKVFKSSFIKHNRIRFDETMASNDVMFNIKAGSMASSISAHDTLMYYVTVSKTSLTKKKDRELLRCRFDVLINHYKFVVSLGKPQCAYNMLKYAIRYSKPYGLAELLYYVRKMINNRINPFVILCKIGRYD